MIDIGNTATNVGFWGKSLSSAFFPTERRATPDSQAVNIINAMSLRGVNRDDIDGAAVCSVVPGLTNALVSAVKSVFGIAPVVIGPGVKTGLNIQIENPAQLGADLAATAVGAASEYPLPCLVYDLGTATKISAVAKGGVYLGGVICPGLAVSMNALGDAAALLPNIAADAPPERAIGANTVDAMQSGALYGTAGALDALADRMEAEIGEECFRVATGGLAEGVVTHCRKKPVYDRYLIFKGMKVIYDKNSR
jgi:type III pantothenate kinase